MTRKTTDALGSATLETSTQALEHALDLGIERAVIFVYKVMLIKGRVSVINI